MSRSPCTVAVRHLRLCVNPKPKLVQVGETDLAATHPVESSAAGRQRGSSPNARPCASAAKDHTAQLITQLLGCIGIALTTEAFGKIEELLLLSPFGLDPHPAPVLPIHCRGAARRRTPAGTRRSASAVQQRPPDVRHSISPPGLIPRHNFLNQPMLGSQLRDRYACLTLITHGSCPLQRYSLHLS